MVKLRNRNSSAMTDRAFLIKFSRYFAVGGVAAVAEWLAFALLHFSFGMYHLWAAILAFFMAVVVNYALSVRYVFVTGRHRRELEVFLVYVVSTVGAVVNIGLFMLLADVLEIPIMVAKIAGTGAAFLWNFFARHWWIFSTEQALPGSGRSER